MPGWELSWAISGGGPEWGDVGREGVLLEDGSAIVAGRLEWHGIFAPQSDNPMSFETGGGADLMLARLDTHGSPVWFRLAGGDPNGFDDEALSMVEAPGGGVLVTGYTSGEPVFGAGEPAETTLPNLGTRFAFLARYDLDGNLEWVTGAGGESIFAHGTSVAALDGGTVLMSGFHTGGTMGFGDAGDEVILETSGGGDGFVAGYDGSGEIEWVVPGCAGSGDDTVVAVAADGSTFVAAGRFEGQVVCRGTDGANVDLASAGEASLFLARFGAGGDLLWVRDVGIDGWVESEDFSESGLSVLANGDIALAGSYGGTMMAGLDGQFQPVTSSYPYHTIAFLARFDPTGQPLWVATARGTDALYQKVNDVVELADGTIAVAGTCFLPAVFGEDEANETVLEGDGIDGFLALYGPNGYLEWVLGQSGPGEAQSLGIDASENALLLTGAFAHDTWLGTGPLDFVAMNSEGLMDFFAMKMDRVGVPLIPR